MGSASFPKVIQLNRTNQPAGKGRTLNWRKLLQSDFLTLGMCAILVVVSAGVTPGMASRGNLVNVLSVAAPLLIVALGQMLVMISGGIDLSITAILAMTSVCGAWLISGDGGWLGGSPWAPMAVCVVMPVIGAVLGLGNGICVAYLRMPPFIATLTSMMFLYGLANWATHSENIGGLPESFIRLGTHTLLQVVLAVVLAAAVALALGCTKYGRWLKALGQREQTAVVSGVPVHRVQCGVYGLAGLLAGIAAIIYTSQLETGSPALGKNLLLDVIGAVVIGGTSLFGGKGKVSWTLGGVLFIALLDNVLNLQNLSYFAVGMSKGALILFAALLDSLRHRWSVA